MRGSDIEAPLAEKLAAIRERSDRPLGPAAGSLPISNPAVRWLMESAADVPALVAAVEFAARFHPLADGSCVACDDLGVGTEDEPCELRAGITRELTREGLR